MKALPIILSFCFAIFTANVFGQVVEMDPIPAKKPSTAIATTKVYESEENMVTGTNNAIIVTLEVTSEKLVEKTWKEFMKDYGGKTKGAKGGKEDMTTGASIVGIGGVNSLTIYSRTSTDVDGYVELLTWFDLGDGEYLSSNRRKNYEEAEAMLLKFAHEVKVEGTKDELEDAEKKLKNFEREMDKLQRQNTGYHQDIADAEKKIEIAKENIVKNEQQQADSTQKIDLQKQLVEEIQRRLSEMKKQ